MFICAVYLRKCNVLAFEGKVLSMKTAILYKYVMCFHIIICSCIFSFGKSLNFQISMRWNPDEILAWIIFVYQVQFVKFSLLHRLLYGEIAAMWGKPETAYNSQWLASYIMRLCMSIADVFTELRWHWKVGWL